MKLRWLALVLALAWSQDDLGRVARELIEKFRSGDLETREAATRKLKDLGPAAKAELGKFVGDGDAEVARLASNLIQRLDLQGSLPKRLQEALPGLAERLAFGGDPAWTEAFLAVALKCESPGRLPILTRKELEPLLSRAVRGAATEETRSLVARAINTRRLYEPPLDLLPLLEDPKHGIRPSIVEAVNRNPPEAIVRRLIEWTRDEKPFLRARAIEDLGVLGIRDAIPEAERLLRDEDVAVRRMAVSALADLQAKEASGKILPLLKNSETIVRRGALEALGRLYARDAIPGIEELLRDKDGEFRCYALETLANLDARESIPKIIPLLKDPGEDVREAAVYALRDLRAREAITEVNALLSDPDDYVENARLSFLDEVDPKQAVAISLERLKNPGEALARGRAAAHLGQLGGPEAVAGLVDALKDKEDYVAAKAAIALQALGDRRGLPTLMRVFDTVLSDQDEIMRTLAKLGAKEIVPKVVLRLKDSQAGTRIAAALSLGLLGAEEAADTLEPLLKDPEQYVRYQAVYSLARLQKRKAIPRLLPMLKDKSVHVVRCTLISLGIIRAWDHAAEVAPLLEDLDSGVRFQAAAWLARAGSRLGVPELLDQYEGTHTSLNALRDPETWKRLDGVTAPLDSPGTVLQKIERVALAAGMRVIVEPSPLGDSQRRLVRMEKGAWFIPGESVVVALYALVPQSHAVVIEKDRIRLMTRAAGDRFWRAWWKEQQSATK